MEASMESFKNSNASTPIGEEPSETGNLKLKDNCGQQRISSLIKEF